MSGNQRGLWGIAGALTGVGLALSACSGHEHDCTETRTCRSPIGYIDAGNFDDWWSAGGPGTDSRSDDAGLAGAGGAGESTSPFETGGAAGAFAAGGTVDFGDAASVAGEAGAATTADRDTAFAEAAIGSDAVAEIERVSPADGALGVERDVRIVVTFAQPMDTVSVENAYQSSDLPATALRFTWDPAHSALTLTPKSALVYQSGAPTTAQTSDFYPKTYHYGFASSAFDNRGRSLSARRFAFSTLREIDSALSADPERTGTWTDGEGEGTHNCVRDTQAPYLPTVCVGDDSNNVRFTGFISFDLSELPSDIVRFESARLASEAVIYGWPDQLGANRLEHVSFGDLGEDALSAPADANLGPFYGGVALSTGGRVELSDDLTSAVAEDYQRREGRSNRSQYRLAFPRIVANDTWDDVELTTANIQLSLTYLEP